MSGTFKPNVAGTNVELQLNSNPILTLEAADVKTNVAQGTAVNSLVRRDFLLGLSGDAIPCFACYKSFTPTTGAWTALGSVTESFDYGSCLTASTGRFVAPVKGIYQFTINLDNNTSNQKAAAIHRNGTYYAQMFNDLYAAGQSSTSLVLCDVGDYFEAYYYAAGSQTLAAIFNGHLIRQVP